MSLKQKAVIGFIIGLLLGVAILLGQSLQDGSDGSSSPYPVPSAQLGPRT